MSLNLNMAIIAGRLTRDPELRTTTSGISVTSFTVAVDRGYGDNKQTDFIDCIAWRDRADFVSKYFRKGMAICVTGEITTRSYEDKDKNKRKATEISARDVDFVESKANSSAPQDAAVPAAAPAATTPAAPTATQRSMFDHPSPEDDDDLPF